MGRVCSVDEKKHVDAEHAMLMIMHADAEHVMLTLTLLGTGRACDDEAVSYHVMLMRCYEMQCHVIRCKVMF